ncbi:hypothetical protein BH09BAC1_BH09BAC1_04750 [soil metagenome]
MKMHATLFLTIFFLQSAFAQINPATDTMGTASLDISIPHVSSSPTSGETNDAGKDKNEDPPVTKSDLDNMLLEIKKTIEESADNQDVVVGTLKLDKTHNVTVNKFMGKSANPKYTNVGSVTIEKVYFQILEGYILNIEITAKTDDGIKVKFTNKRAPIALTYERINAGYDYLGNGNGLYLLLKDFISIDTKGSYVSDDDEFELTPENNEHDLIKASGINSVLDIRLYTDALALFGEESNGLVQTDIYFKQSLHRTNLRNTGAFLFNKIKFNLTASKFDSKQGVVDSIDFSRSLLLQKNWLTTDLALTAFSCWAGKKSLSTFYIDFGGHVDISKTVAAQDTINVTSVGLFADAILDLKISKNIGSSVMIRSLIHWSPEVENSGCRFFVRPQFSIYWNPLGNPSSRLFARAIYTAQVDDIENHYLQVQLGYTLQLSNIISKVKKD